MNTIRVVDLRLIFDNEEQQCIIGCHSCEKHEGKSVTDIPAIAKMIPEFSVTHMQSCGKALD